MSRGRAVIHITMHPYLVPQLCDVVGFAICGEMIPRLPVPFSRTIQSAIRGPRAHRKGVAGRRCVLCVQLSVRFDSGVRW